MTQPALSFGSLESLGLPVGTRSGIVRYSSQFGGGGFWPRNTSEAQNGTNGIRLFEMFFCLTEPAPLPALRFLFWAKEQGLTTGSVYLRYSGNQENPDSLVFSTLTGGDFIQSLTLNCNIPRGEWMHLYARTTPFGGTSTLYEVGLGRTGLTAGGQGVPSDTVPYGASNGGWRTAAISPIPYPQMRMTGFSAFNQRRFGYGSYLDQSGNQRYKFIGALSELRFWSVSRDYNTIENDKDQLLRGRDRSSDDTEASLRQGLLNCFWFRDPAGTPADQILDQGQYERRPWSHWGAGNANYSSTAGLESHPYDFTPLPSVYEVEGESSVSSSSSQASSDTYWLADLESPSLNASSEGNVESDFVRNRNSTSLSGSEVDAYAVREFPPITEERSAFSLATATRTSIYYTLTVTSDNSTASSELDPDFNLTRDPDEDETDSESLASVATHWSPFLIQSPSGQAEENLLAEFRIIQKPESGSSSAESIANAIFLSKPEAASSQESSSLLGLTRQTSVEPDPDTTDSESIANSTVSFIKGARSSRNSTDSCSVNEQEVVAPLPDLGGTSTSEIGDDYRYSRQKFSLREVSSISSSFLRVPCDGNLIIQHSNSNALAVHVFKPNAESDPSQASSIAEAQKVSAVNAENQTVYIAYSVQKSDFVLTRDLTELEMEAFSVASISVNFPAENLESTNFRLDEASADFVFRAIVQGTGSTAVSEIDWQRQSTAPVEDSGDYALDEADASKRISRSLPEIDPTLIAEDDGSITIIWNSQGLRSIEKAYSLVAFQHEQSFGVEAESANSESFTIPELETRFSSPVEDSAYFAVSSSTGTKITAGEGSSDAFFAVSEADAAVSRTLEPSSTPFFYADSAIEISTRYPESVGSSKGSYSLVSFDSVSFHSCLAVSETDSISFVGPQFTPGVKTVYTRDLEDIRPYFEIADTPVTRNIPPIQDGASEAFLIPPEVVTRFSRGTESKNFLIPDISDASTNYSRNGESGSGSYMIAGMDAVSFHSISMNSESVSFSVPPDIICRYPTGFESQNFLIPELTSITRFTSFNGVSADYEVSDALSISKVTEMLPTDGYLIPEEFVTANLTLPRGVSSNHFVWEDVFLGVGFSYHLIDGQLSTGGEAGAAANYLIPELFSYGSPSDGGTADTPYVPPIEINGSCTHTSFTVASAGGAVSLRLYIDDDSGQPLEPLKEVDALAIEDIWNEALVLLGAPTIESISDGSAEADIISKVWDNFRCAFLSDHTWNGAVTILTLSRMTDAAGTEVSAPLNWRYVYKLPDDYCRAWRVNGELAGGTEGVHWQIKAHKIDGQYVRVMYCNEDKVDLEYIYDIGNSVSILTAQTREAMAYALAAKIAPKIGLSEGEINGIQQRASVMIANAKGSDGQEGTPIFFPRNTLLEARDPGRYRRPY